MKVLNVMQGLGFVTAAFVLAYWASVFVGVFPVVELVPGYRAWFMSFPVADVWIAAWCLALGLAARRGATDDARAAALVAGSSLVFLGLYAGTYGAVTGLLWSGTVDEAIEIAIKLYCLGAGTWLIVQGLPRRQRTLALAER